MELKRHMQKVHAGHEVTPLKKLLPQKNHYIKEQKCETCDKIFTNDGDLLVHLVQVIRLVCTKIHTFINTTRLI